MPFKDTEYHKKYLAKWKKEHEGRYPEYFLKYRERNREKLRQLSKEYWKRKKLSRPKNICRVCDIKFFGRINQIYCSKKCKEISRSNRRRKNPDYKLYQKIYQKEWDKKNPDKRREINKRFDGSEKRKIWRKNWMKTRVFKRIKKKWYDKNGKKYAAKWRANNPDKVRMSQYKFAKSDKGKLNNITKIQRRRKKFGFEKPSIEVIKLVDARDKKCVYCGREFSGTGRERFAPTYDHLDAFKPLSEINAVKVHYACNSSKQDKPVLKWLKEKGYQPSPVVLELLKKQEATNENKKN